MLRIDYFVFFILILIPCTSLADSKIILAEHKYVMGDNDSKNDARRMCFLEANVEFWRRQERILKAVPRLRIFN